MGFNADIDKGRVQLIWTPNPDVDMDRYEIRYHPTTDGQAVWEACSYVAALAKEVNAKTVPARSGTYMIKAYDTSNIPSLVAQSVIVPKGAFDNFNVVQTFTEGPLWAGQHSSTVGKASQIPGDDGNTLRSYITKMVGKASQIPGDDGVAKLHLLGGGFIEGWDNLASLPSMDGYFPSSGIYELSLGGLGYFDLGGVFSTFVTAAADLTDFAPVYNMESWGLLSTMGTLTGGSKQGTTSVTFQVSTTEDDPASPSAMWTPWDIPAPGAYDARTFKIRAMLGTNDRATTPVIRQITVGFDMEDRVVSLQDLTVPATGIYVPITPPFKGENVTVTQGPHNLPSSTAISVTGKSRSGFFIAAPGAPAPITIDLQVRGYGEQTVQN